MPRYGLFAFVNWLALPKPETLNADLDTIGRMYMRLAFAVAAHLDTDILIVDEVLAVGDLEFQKK